MELEFRVTNVEQVTPFLDYPIDIISIGHGGCPHKLPSKNEIQTVGDEIYKSGKKLTLLIPICYEDFSENVLELIKVVRKFEQVGLVVNDWGTLLALVDRGWHEQLIITIGEGLSFSFALQPWFQETLNSETDKQANDFLHYSLDNKHLLKKMGIWNVKSLIIPNLINHTYGLSQFVDNEVYLQMLMSPFPLAYSRSCHTARYYHAEIPNCTHLCNDAFELTMTDKWNLFFDQHQPMSNKSKDRIPTLQVYGNIVYSPLPIKHEIPEAVNRLIWDTRFHTYNELKEQIEQFLEHNYEV